MSDANTECLIDSCSNEAVRDLWFCETCEKLPSIVLTSTLAQYREDVLIEQSQQKDISEELIRILESGKTVMMTKDFDRYVVTVGTLSRARETLAEALKAVSE